MSTIGACATALLRGIGRDAGGLHLQALGTGGNNRLYKLRCAGGVYALKQYFSHPGDRRDRLGAESAFLRHLEREGVTGVPVVLASDAAANVALFQWVEGARPSVVDTSLVEQAAGFFAAINATRARALDLPSASEASFSIAEALELVERRLQRLMNVSRDSTEARQAAGLVDEMNGLWPQVRRETCAQAAALGMSVDEEVGVTQRCLSPSDFGFHNVLVDAGGGLTFVDFEYAGWDDPAKMVADFFCQPALPVSLRHWDLFVSQALAPFQDAAAIARRAQLLLPAFQLRWCALALNPFLPVSRARRQFSLAMPDETQHRRHQLRIAQNLLEQVSG